jgi:hypothetical protein
MCRPQECERDRGACQTFSGDAGEVALGEGRRSPYHLGRRRDTGQPGETIDIPINTGEQSSLALPKGEGHEPSMDMQLPHACSEPLASHCETGLVSRRLLGLRASCPSLPSPSRAGGPAAASACSHLGLVLADGLERHGFCSLSIAETEKPRQDALCGGWGEATGAFLSEKEIPMATPLLHTTAGTKEAHFLWRSVRVYAPGARGRSGGGPPGVFGLATMGPWPWCDADRGAVVGDPSCKA